MPQPLFFDSSGEARLFGVWRPARHLEAQRVWVLCGPFAEEEKAARRTLTDLAEAFAEEGAASLVFAYRGTGDSSGSFSDASLPSWMDDIRTACHQARALAGGPVPLSLLGVRLGASLALRVGGEVGAAQLILLEPVLNGRSYLAQMNRRKQLRGMMTQEEAGVAAPSAPGGASPPPDAISGSSELAEQVDDLDGWPLGPGLREGLQGLNLMNEAAASPSGVHVRLLQVGPRPEPAPPLRALAAKLGCEAEAVVMQPFWNLLDYVKPAPLIEQLIGLP